MQRFVTAGLISLSHDSDCGANFVVAAGPDERHCLGRRRASSRLDGGRSTLENKLADVRGLGRA
jgi:hypothetical protein